jgi:hypothetical protein
LKLKLAKQEWQMATENSQPIPAELLGLDPRETGKPHVSRHKEASILQDPLDLFEPTWRNKSEEAKSQREQIFRMEPDNYRLSQNKIPIKTQVSAASAYHSVGGIHDAEVSMEQK